MELSLARYFMVEVYMGMFSLGRRNYVICPLLLKAPFVCNPCGRRLSNCRFRKQFYHAKTAQQKYETPLSELHEGIPLNKEALYEIDKIVSSGIKGGQHLYHIMQTHDLSWVEMYFVIGRISGKAIMTMDFTFCNFTAGLLLHCFRRHWYGHSCESFQAFVQGILLHRLKCFRAK